MIGAIPAPSDRRVAPSTYKLGAPPSRVEAPRGALGVPITTTPVAWSIRPTSPCSRDGAVMTVRPPIPPFTHESATQKVHGCGRRVEPPGPGRALAGLQRGQRLAQSGQLCARSDRDRHLPAGQVGTGARLPLGEGDLVGEGSRIGVRYCYESPDPEGRWWRSFGNENWEFDDDGLMRVRHPSINDVPITESERKLVWEPGMPRPADRPGLTHRGV